MTDMEGDQLVISQAPSPPGLNLNWYFLSSKTLQCQIPPISDDLFHSTSLNSNSCDKPIHNSEIPFDRSELGWEGLVPLN